MAGTVAGGKAAAATNKAKYGKDFYKHIGRIGGSTVTDKLKGFATNLALASAAGVKGGKKSRRG